MKFKGGGATRKTGSCCGLQKRHSGPDPESINADKDRLRLWGRSDECGKIIPSSFRHSELDSESLNTSTDSGSEAGVTKAVKLQIFLLSIIKQNIHRPAIRSEEGSRMSRTPSRHSDGSQSLLMPINLIRYLWPQKSRKAAFTMAEVLITLGIIGIVAAMTLPSLLNNIRNKELESRFKTAYSLVSQAVLRMSVDEPQIAVTYCAKTADGTFGDELNNTFIIDFSKYFQAVTVNNKINISENLTKLGYKRDYFEQPYKSEHFNQDGHDNGYMILKNGMIIFSSGCWWDSASGAPVDFVVDTNGLKAPNKFGYDVFYFQIVEDNVLMPSNSKYSYKSAATNDASCCNFKEGGTCEIPNDNGVACTYFAIMDKFPNDETKSYWKSLP